MEEDSVLAGSTVWFVLTSPTQTARFFQLTAQVSRESESSTNMPHSLVLLLWQWDIVLLLVPLTPANCHRRTVHSVETEVGAAAVRFHSVLICFAPLILVIQTKS